MLRAAQEALIDGSNKHLEIVQEIRKDHLNAARAVIQNKEILSTLETQLDNECLKLRSFLEAAEVKKKILYKKGILYVCVCVFLVIII